MSDNRTLRPALRLLPRGAVAGLATTALLAFGPTTTAAHATTAAATTAPATTAPAARTHRPLTSTERVHRAFTIARHQIGDPYVYGATGPNAFDCSGLVYYSYHRAGFHGLPRTSSAQAGYARHIPRSQMRVGDLVFFTGGGGVYHVGIYDGMHHGRRYIIHAPYPGRSVEREAIWTDSWFAGTLRRHDVNLAFRHAG